MLTVALDDKYLATAGRVYVTGSQALVRLALDQARSDVAAGLNTAGFISGYRGSPLGMLDMALWQAERHLKANRIHFQPGVNEDLAATAVWGSQQVPLLQGARYDGVFGLWYGKGPGVDRSGDVLKHGSFAGSSATGGVLALCGDDHGARSSTLAHQSDHALIHYGIPLLHPADLQEYLDLGLFGFAMSRYSGCWVGFKCVTDTVDGSGSIQVDRDRVQVVTPTDFELPPDGLNIRFESAILKQEARLFEQRHLAVQAFARANRLDQVRLGTSNRKRLGIVSTGKSYLDVMEALGRLGIGRADAEALGIGVYKVAMVWPLEPEGLRAFAGQCDELVVIEEKRGVIEEQIAYLLYNMPADQRPRLTGKRDEDGRPFISEVGELGPDQVMQALAGRYLKLNESSDIRARFNDVLDEKGEGAPTTQAEVIRPPSFCAGCPHNTSTHVPDGSIAMAGIGCHGMAMFLPGRNTLAIYHMGGEGAPWIGQAPFVETPHIFQNIGDGTYFHSGLLALRACVASGVNITYKILLNGAVGMTGGQPIEGEKFEGEIAGPHVAQQVHAEGVRRIAVVTEDMEKFGARSEFPEITTFHHRDDLDAVQREIREWKGVSVLIYDQSCATERRRMRKRGKIPESEIRMYIQPDVCEGCGDCGIQSNCVAIEPLETELGRKRKINQSVCNQDISCLKGFCPSFITVEGGRVRARSGTGSDSIDVVTGLPEPTPPSIEQTFSLLVTGIGGTGVVTIGAILGMAAHIEEKRCTVLDMSGFAQRNGAVMSHVRFAPAREEGHSARIPPKSADVILGCDPIVTASPDAVGLMAAGRTSVVMNCFVAPTNAFALNPDWRVDLKALETVIGRRIGADHLYGSEATQIATSLLGDAIGANMFVVGYGWQKGLIPLRRESIERAIELNGAATEMNLRAFALGRLAAERPEEIERMRGEKNDAKPLSEQSLAEIVASRSRHLADYQNMALAERYRALVDRVQAAEGALGDSCSGLAAAAAHVYAKLLSYKDEYEVARLFVAGSFRAKLNETFEGDYKIHFNLAPPLLARRDPATGRLRKIRFGSWILLLFRILAPLKAFRGTIFDIFGYTAHRRTERRLIRDYEALVERILSTLKAQNHGQAVALLMLAESVRGYDVVKEEHAAEVRKRQGELIAEYETPGQGGQGAVASRAA